MKITPIPGSDAACRGDASQRGAVFSALGNFDGVHKGHMELLRAAREEAKLLSARTAVFTFRQGKAPAITTLEERLALFEAAGIEEVFVADFHALCGQSPQEFVASTLRPLGVVGVSCGFNFRFGYRAAGDVKLLASLCESLGMVCRVVPAVTAEGCTVSSTEIRRRIAEGDPESAARLLCRPWSVSAEVAHGRSVGGRVLSSPTLNLPLTEERLLPPFGVYFTETVIEGICYPSVTNLGKRPTFGESEVLCETHLLGVSGDFYGKRAEVRFYKFHRPEQRFDSPEMLAKTIAEDIAAANDYFQRRQATLCGTTI